MKILPTCQLLLIILTFLTFKDPSGFCVRLFPRAWRDFGAFAEDGFGDCSVQDVVVVVQVDDTLAVELLGGIP